MVDSGRLREISWQELFPWLRIVAALRLAVSPSLLALGAIAMVATAAGWRAIGALYSESDNSAVQSIVTYTSSWPWERPVPARDAVPDSAADIRASPFWMPWDELSLPFRSTFDYRTSFVPFTMLLLMAIWALLVWSIFGAAITRIAAVALARGDRPGFRAGLAHGVRRWPLYAFGPAIPLAGVFFLGLLLTALGFAMKLDFFVLLASIVWPIVLVIGFVMALLLIGLAVGWPLMWPTISVETTDAFDALSRAYSYAFHRPIRYLFYVIIAAALGVMGWYIVDLFTRWIIDLSYWGISWGATAERTTEISNNTHLLTQSSDADVDWNTFKIGTAIIGVWHACLFTLALGFIYSYFWSAATAIYYVLRRDEDGTEMSEVTYEDAREMRGLPPLGADALGVPAVSDLPPPASSPPPQPPLP
jgi:hypothetical protein